MPATATLPASNSTLTVSIDQKMTLKKLLEAAGIEDVDENAVFFWTLAGRSPDRPVKLHGVEVTFFKCPSGVIFADHVRNTLWQERMMPVTVYEIFCLAASDPSAFLELLRSGGLVVPTPEDKPFMYISNQHGEIVIQRWEQEGDFQGCQFAGACFAPIGD